MSSALSEKLAELQALDRKALCVRWEAVFRRPAPMKISRDLLMRALAYHVQEQAEGGLSKAVLTRLTGREDPKPVGSSMKPPTPRPRTGTRLIREWRGEVHQVTVLDGEFEYRGTRYTSLSRIAREITGTRWSGPVFFGLRKPAGRAEASPDGR